MKQYRDQIDRIDAEIVRLIGQRAEIARLQHRHAERDAVVRRQLVDHLLASKRPCQRKDSLARIVGDRLKEKGKDRQLVCRGGDREFLTWMHKLKLKSQYERGDLIEIKKSTKTSNEIRLESDEDCRAIHDETLHPG